MGGVEHPGMDEDPRLMSVAALRLWLEDLSPAPTDSPEWLAWIDFADATAQVIDPEARARQLRDSLWTAWESFHMAGDHADHARLQALAEGWLTMLGDMEEHPTAEGVNVTELRRLEVVVQATATIIHEHRLDAEARSLLQAAVDTIQAQIRSFRPDRSIIGRSLVTVAGFAGGLLTGVAGNYLTDLLKAFHQLPWPR